MSVYHINTYWLTSLKRCNCTSVSLATRSTWSCDRKQSLESFTMIFENSLVDTPQMPWPETWRKKRSISWIMNKLWTRQNWFESFMRSKQSRWRSGAAALSEDRENLDRVRNALKIPTWTGSEPTGIYTNMVLCLWMARACFVPLYSTSYSYANNDFYVFSILFLMLLFNN